MLKVTKFGGSSLCDSAGFSRVREIVLADPARRVVVVSAAGKRHTADHKITDLLYLCHAHLQYGVSCWDLWRRIADRYREIRDGCCLTLPIEAELCNDCTIAVDVLLGEVVEKASALADHHQKAAAGMVVLLVLTQMLGQSVDPGGEDSDLNLGRTGVAGMGCVLLDNGSLFFFAHHSCVSTFQKSPRRTK